MTVVLGAIDVALRVALAVQRQEFAMSKKLGDDALSAHIVSWAAYDDILSIANNPDPVFYQTTEAKMIGSRA